MKTRRTFLATLAALAVAPLVKFIPKRETFWMPIIFKRDGFRVLRSGAPSGGFEFSGAETTDTKYLWGRYIGRKGIGSA